MKARLLAVQRMLWMLVAASLALCVLAFPRGRNRDYMTALEELTVFRAGFHQQELETSLLNYAQSQGSVTVAEIAKHIAGPGVPSAGAKPDAGAVKPLAEVHLRTLAEVLARGAGATTVPIGVLHAADLADSIAWRLSRQPASGNVMLSHAEVTMAQASEADVKLEHDITQARAQALAAQTAFTQATAQLTAAEELFEARKKWKASWKAILKAGESRKEAKAALAQRQAELTGTQTRYESLAKQALAFSAKPPAAGADPGFAAATVVVQPAQGAPLTLQIPVALEVRQASLPPLQGTAFSATHAADLWDEVKDKAPDQAVALVQKRFTWQYQYVKLGALKLGGMTLLHFLPVALPTLLLLLLVRIRRVSVTYNPFGLTDNDDLPRVGLGPRALDLTALSILPFVAGILDIVALTAVAEIPVLPVLCALLSLGVGVYVYIELGSLQSLTEAVTRSRSTPPPPRN